MALTGEDIVNTLRDIKSPASLTAIVANLRSKDKGSETTLIEEAKVLIEAGVRFGYIVAEDNKYKCKEQVTKDEPNADKNNETPKVTNNKENSSSNGRKENSKNKRSQTTQKIDQQNPSSENDENDNLNDSADCYGPSYKRRRSRSRSRRRNRRGKRLRSRRRRAHV